MSTPKRPGWYPAPDRNGEQWWNGVSWSESRRSHRTISPAASVAYDAATGHYCNSGAPAAVPAIAPPVASSALQGQALMALVLAGVGLFVNVVAIPALIVAVATRHRNRALGAVRSISNLVGAAIALSIVGLILMATQFGLWTWLLFFFA